METRHLRIGFEDALNSKKELLTSEINLLQVLKKVKSYKLLRKKELTLKNKLRLQVKALMNSLNGLDGSLPEHQKAPKTDKLKKEINTKESRDIQKELKEIKKKLEGLQ